MSTNKIVAGKAYIEAVIRDRLGPGLAKMKARLSSFGAGAARVGGAAIGAATSVLAPAALAVKQFLSAGDQLDKMSQRTNTSVESLSTLGYAASITGQDIQTTEKMIKGLDKTMRAAEQGSKKQVDALAAIGLTAAELENLSTEDRIKAISEAMQGVDPNQRAAIAMDIFGSAGQKMLPFLNLGADGISNLQARAKELGLQMSTEDAAAAAELTDSFFELGQIAKGIAIQVGAALAPAINWATSAMVNASSGAVDFVKNNRGIVIAVVGGAAAVGVLGLGLIFLGMAAGGAATAIGILAAVISFITSPIGLLTVAVAGGVAAWFAWSESGGQAADFLTQKLGSLLTWGQEIFGGLQDAIATGDWETAGNILWTTLEIAWRVGTGKLMGIWLDFRDGAISIFDAIGVSLKIGWLETMRAMVQGVAFLIDKINVASEALTGVRAIAIDTETIGAALDSAIDSSQRDSLAGLADRDQQRASARAETLKGFETTDLDDKLAGLVEAAQESRVAMQEATDAAKEEKRAKAKEGIEAVPAAVAEVKSASQGAFSLQNLEAFARGSQEETELAERSAAANERTATAVEEISEQAGNNEILVTSGA